VYKIKSSTKFALFKRFLTHLRRKMGKNIKAIDRVKKNIDRLAFINFNDNSCLYTLSFNDDVKDIDNANKEFSNFIKRAKYKLGDFKYIATLQFKRNGVIKYFMLAKIGFSHRNVILKAWGNGWVWADVIKHETTLKLAILDMQKGIADERLIGKKAYFTSKSLKRV
jgi:hypothetical protein